MFERADSLVRRARAGDPLGRQRLTEEVFQRETGVLTQKVHVDLDPDAATRLDTNHATDHSDFVACQCDEESHL